MQKDSRIETIAAVVCTAPEACSLFSYIVLTCAVQGYMRRDGINWGLWGAFFNEGYVAFTIEVEDRATGLMSVRAALKELGVLGKSDLGYWDGDEGGFWRTIYSPTTDRPPVKLELLIGPQAMSAATAYMEAALLRGVVMHRLPAEKESRE